MTIKVQIVANSKRKNNNSGLSLVYFNVCPTQSQSGPECVMSGDKTRPSDEAGEPLPGGGAVQAVQ